MLSARVVRIEQNARCHIARTCFAAAAASDVAHAARSGQVQIPRDSPTTISQILPRQRRPAAISKTACDAAARRGAMATYLLELLDGTLVDTAALVDQVCDAVSQLQ